MSYSITITNSALSTDSVVIQVDSTSATAQTIAVGQSLTVTCDKVYYPSGTPIVEYSVSNLVNCTDEPYSPLVRRPYITPTADNASCTITVESGGPDPEPPEPEPGYPVCNYIIMLDGNLIGSGTAYNANAASPTVYPTRLSFAGIFSYIDYNSTYSTTGFAFQTGSISIYGSTSGNYLNSMSNGICYINNQATTVPVTFGDLRTDPTQRTINSFTTPYINALSDTLYINLYSVASGYTITYETNGGTSVPQATGQTALPNPLPTTTKTGYAFDGWYTDSTLTTPAVAGASISQNTTLYAKWKKAIDLTTLPSASALLKGNHKITVKAKGANIKESNYSKFAIGNKQTDPPVTITPSFTNVTCSPSSATQVARGGSQSFSLGADSTSYRLPTSITVSGTSVSAGVETEISGKCTVLFSRNSDTSGSIAFSNVTDDVAFSVVAEVIQSVYTVTLNYRGLFEESGEAVVYIDGSSLAKPLNSPSYELTPNTFTVQNTIRIVGSLTPYLSNGTGNFAGVSGNIEDRTFTITQNSSCDYIIND